jgi:hypothetical protein
MRVVGRLEMWQTGFSMVVLIRFLVVRPAFRAGLSGAGLCAAA